MYRTQGVHRHDFKRYYVYVFLPIHPQVFALLLMYIFVTFMDPLFISVVLCWRERKPTSPLSFHLRRPFTSLKKFLIFFFFFYNITWPFIARVFHPQFVLPTLLLCLRWFSSFGRKMDSLDDSDVEVYVEAPPIELKCPVCLDFVRDPVCVSISSMHFCISACGLLFLIIHSLL